MRRHQLALGVLWDLDGVLADTATLHYMTWVNTLSRRGVEFTHDEFQKMFGMNNATTLRALLGEQSDPHVIQEISDEKETAFRQAIRGKVRALPGVRIWLNRLKYADARQAVASSAPAENISALLAELQLLRFFGAAVSGAELPAKPDPTLFFTAARSIGLDPGRCVVIEDSPSGIEAARLAGMKCIGVATTHPASSMRGAHLVVERLDRLPRGTFEALAAGDPIDTWLHARPDR
jgi:HAD superfamily hydrolase (TIGR01509 family)